MEYKALKWTFLISAFDIPSWLCILAVFILISLVSYYIQKEINISLITMETFASLLKQGRIPRFNLIMSVWVFAGILLNFYYESFITSELTLPKKIYIYEGLKDLLDNGYILVTHPDMKSTKYLEYFGKFGLTESKIIKIFFSKDDERLSLPSKYSGLTVEYLLNAEKYIILQKLNHFCAEDCKCFSTEKHDAEISLGLVKRGKYSFLIFKIYKTLVESGITIFFHKIRVILRF